MNHRTSSSLHILRVLAALVIGAWILGSCAKGEKRDFLGPPDPTPVDRTIAAVVVVPHIGTLQQGEPLDLSAFARNGKGDSMAVDVNWSATGGSLQGPGRFVASTPGSYWVVARSVLQADKADSANVVVVGTSNPITRVAVSPKTLAVRVGQSRQFSAVAYYQDGTPAPAPIFWSTSGGTIDPGGLYTPPATPGDYLVIAVVGSGLTDTAMVSVGGNPTLTALSIDPVTDSVSQGATLKYTVTATWSDGSTGPPVVDFSTSGGMIDTSGLFTAAASPGPYDVRAKERGGIKSASARVWVEQPFTSLRVSPATLSLAPGSSWQFGAAGVMPDGTARSIDVTWQATGGTISADGQYVAGSTEGSFQVIAKQVLGVLADTAEVTIAAPAATLTQLVVNPSSVTVPAGGTYQFTASGSWSDGGSMAPLVDWSATGGTISAQGVYTAGTVAGTYRVIGKHHGGTLADTSVVTVSPASITALTVTPGTASVEAGKTQQFSATAVWSDGAAHSLPALSWSATGGTVSGSGLYSAGSNPGTYSVIARDQATSKADTSFVTVTSPPPALQAIVVSPPSVTLFPGDRQDFFVTAVWTNGGSGVPSVTWSATGGSISSGGSYTAGSTTGTFRVVALDPVSGKADTAAISIVPKAPVLTGIQLLPEGATVQAGGLQQYSVRGIWSDGGTSAPAVYYMATGGTISSSGLYTAGATTGTFRVIAKQQNGTLADTVAVTITSAAPVLTGLSLTPASASVTTGASKQFAVAGIWTNGGTGTPAVTWAATGGTVTQSGLFTAGSTPGTYRVVVTEQGGTLADTAAVTVATTAPTVTSLAIQPGNVTLQSGARQEFSVTATWSDGSTTPPAVTWSATGGGTITADGVFTAGSTPGTWQVMAREQGGKADTVSVTVGSAYVTKISLTPSSASLGTGATQQFAVTATWSDGANRTVAVSYRATGGTITVGGLYTAGQITGAFSVIALCTCGKADTSGVTITQNNTSATLSSLTLSPSSVTLATGATQQFTTTAQWSDGSTTLPALTYSAIGGTISQSGLYTAPAATGSYKVVVASSGKADTAAVSVQTAPPPSPTPWMNEDFTGYSSTADLLSAVHMVPNGLWTNEDVNTGRISLDQSDGCGSLCGVPSGQSVQSMKYTLPNRSADPNICRDFTVGRNVNFPAHVQEVWIEVWAKLSTNFATKVPNGQCTGISNPQYKFVFLRVDGTSRYDVLLGTYGNETSLGYPDNAEAYSGSPSLSTYLDGRWHRFRFHAKVGNAGIAVGYVDNVLIKAFRNVPINRSYIYGIALGRNMNQGPVQATTVSWGAVRAWNVDPGWGW